MESEKSEQVKLKERLKKVMMGSYFYSQGWPFLQELLLEGIGGFLDIDASMIPKDIVEAEFHYPSGHASQRSGPVPKKYWEHLFLGMRRGYSFDLYKTTELLETFDIYHQYSPRQFSKYGPNASFIREFSFKGEGLPFVEYKPVLDLVGKQIREAHKGTTSIGRLGQIDRTFAAIDLMASPRHRFVSVTGSFNPVERADFLIYKWEKINGGKFFG